MSIGRGDWSLADVALAVGGDVRDAPGDPAAVPVPGPVVLDSRAAEPGALFVAVRGEHVDGHEFAAAAAAGGASAVLAERPVGVPAVVVDDSAAALARLASASLQRLPGLRVVGVTGSSGKTSTKDLLAAVLERAGETVATQGSFNNELGLPLTVLRADASTRWLVLEMGARGIGHIAHLCSVAPPQVGVVLNVGSAHVGEFGGPAAIAQAKGELVEALAPDGLAVLNADDLAVSAMAARTSARVVRFGLGAGADVSAEDITLDALARPRFRLRTPSGPAEVLLRVSGEHQVLNALAAAAVGLEAGLSPEDVAEALSSADARSRWRMEVVERADGVTVVNDAYNANPESVRAALKGLAAMGRAEPARPRRTWAVLGEMRELGDTTREEHDRVGRLAVRLDISRLVAVGAPARAIALGAELEGSWNGESAWVPDVDTAVALLHDEVRPGDVVLVKASRAAGLERVADALLAEPPSADPSAVPSPEAPA
ncbi:UDP-N-acetylmuramoyl-tripeptide--D-alanyl-D-alanine ligase [Motilibacter rhizosphaerae]|uniref:UDP-N-acetylmuramoyl-tripeptide--D-alanyl-D-alanine ligase n=1 Tax=Motilibacter rhizosphaerae TaxID=598652 RepID=A0A4Q7NGH5_9ACTN|nr:UDP-N-acetylmuramoyl-tripeptide--D-alanyl-D-alanine ligase [Motilibacter rhizosphaerae]RZS82922.1 UDP-N-acetylmuramoyl-tripeptide--D-alanyl-D-alanine ligase [Motilibacter rhizosphaerae]